jgi:hypothetical protein
VLDTVGQPQDVNTWPHIVDVAPDDRAVLQPTDETGSFTTRSQALVSTVQRAATIKNEDEFGVELKAQPIRAPRKTVLNLNSSQSSGITTTGPSLKQLRDRLSLQRAADRDDKW